MVVMDKNGGVNGGFAGWTEHELSKHNEHSGLNMTKAPDN